MFGRGARQPQRAISAQALEAMDTAALQRQAFPESQSEYDDMTTRESMTKTIKFLVEEKAAPEELINTFWAYLDKEVTLSQLDANGFRILRRQAFIARDEFLMGIPQYKITPELLLKLQNLKVKFDMKMYRAMGGFERRMETTQIRDTSMAFREPRKIGMRQKVFGGLFG